MSRAFLLIDVLLCVGIIALVLVGFNRDQKTREAVQEILDQQRANQQATPAAEEPVKVRPSSKPGEAEKPSPPTEPADPFAASGFDPFDLVEEAKPGDEVATTQPAEPPAPKQVPFEELAKEPPAADPDDPGEPDTKEVEANKPEDPPPVLETKVYRMEGLLTEDDLPEGLMMIAETVKFVRSDSWGPDGDGRVHATSLPNVDALVVRQTPEIHEEIETLLEELRKIAQGGAERTDDSDPVTAALSREISAHFRDVALADAIEQLAEESKIAIRLDPKLKLDAEQTVTLQASEVPLRTALVRMLRPLGLAMELRDDHVLIAEAKPSATRTRAYAVTKLVTALRDSVVKERGRAEDQLVALMFTAVDAVSWDVLGGPGSVGMIRLEDEFALIVSQTDHNQEDVRCLLDALSKAVRQAEDGEPSPIVANPHTVLDIKTALYPVGDLVIRRENNRPVRVDYESLTQLIDAMCAQGPLESILPFSIGKARLLVATLSDDHHGEVAELLAKLRAAGKDSDEGANAKDP